MATRAYVLIETAVGKTKDVVNTLKGAKGITSVDAVTGPYDIITMLEAETLNAIGDLVTRKVHAASGVTRTTTCMVVELG